MIVRMTNDEWLTAYMATDYNSPLETEIDAVCGNLNAQPPNDFTNIDLSLEAYGELQVLDLSEKINPVIVTEESS